MLQIMSLTGYVTKIPLAKKFKVHCGD